MVQIWLQSQRIHEAVSTAGEVSLVVVRETQVHNRAHVVRPQVYSKLICLNALFCLEKLGTCSTILIPQGMVHGLLFDAFSEVDLSLSEVALKEHQYAECEQNLWISRVLHMGCLKGILNVNKVKTVTF